MTGRGKVWTAVFLTVTGAAVGMELVAALDSNADTVPLTHLITDHVPAQITAGLIALFVLWAPGHFYTSYLTRRKGPAVAHVDPAPDEPIPPAPPPSPHPALAPDPPSEPLLTVALVTTVGAAIVGCIVAFGVHLTGTQQGVILTLVAALAPFIVGVVARKTVYSPATVKRLLEGQRQTRMF